MPQVGACLHGVTNTGTRRLKGQAQRVRRGIEYWGELGRNVTTSGVEIEGIGEPKIGAGLDV